MAKKSKVVNQKEQVSGNKKPKNRENPCAYYDWHPSWNFSMCDFEHEKWSLENSDIYYKIFPKLILFERMKWSDIIVRDKDRNHWENCNEFIKEARDRIVEKKWDFDQLFSLRLEGDMRLYGNIENGIFYLIWYDEKHEIYPYKKKHT